MAFYKWKSAMLRQQMHLMGALVDSTVRHVYIVVEKLTHSYNYTWYTEHTQGLINRMCLNIFLGITTDNDVVKLDSGRNRIQGKETFATCWG